MVVMLTGDSDPVARAVAAHAHVATWHAGRLPEDKLNAVRELEDRTGAVAMVGDGVNDAPRWRPPASASRWAPPAATPRSNRPTWH